MCIAEYYRILNPSYCHDRPNHGHFVRITFCSIKMRNNLDIGCTDPTSLWILLEDVTQNEANSYYNFDFPQGDALANGCNNYDPEVFKNTRFEKAQYNTHGEKETNRAMVRPYCPLCSAAKAAAAKAVADAAAEDAAAEDAAAWSDGEDTAEEE
ncbi:hypothetical protein BU16DRAFT_566880 [Lophium mytilinum]|uniref:Uncharacterized protein n=1 Tax=Lophium mytilinum TaxID=390894 RepID=A0A6A6QBC7_9PEZI|nr:hypothetical protein BU16DRAFT_566880 [Lophium mytilinum]